MAPASDACRPLQKQASQFLKHKGLIILSISDEAHREDITKLVCMVACVASHTVDIFGLFLAGVSDQAYMSFCI